MWFKGWRNIKTWTSFFTERTLQSESSSVMHGWDFFFDWFFVEIFIEDNDNEIFLTFFNLNYNWFKLKFLERIFEHFLELLFYKGYY